MSIFDVFKPAAPAAPAATVATVATTVPVVPEIPPATPPATADPFETLWTQDPKDATTGQQLNFNLDPAALAEIAGKLDYTQAITPELKQRLANGGEDAVQANLEVLNLVSRLGYQQNAVATTKLIEAAVRNTEASMDARIATVIKSMGLGENLSASNPALSNPKFAPIVEAAKKQIIAKNPNATQAELNKLLSTYLDQAGEAFAPGLAARANAPRNTVGNFNQPETDWFEQLLAPQ
jgi:hypothetical protein